jgi:hypothetical protein
MSKQPSSYNAQDIFRYHSGKMSSDEQHALEKAALDDPFLFDAMEGFASNPDAETCIPELNKRLLQRIHKDQRNPLFIRFRTPLSIAASLLFILLAGYFFLQPDDNGSPENNTLADNKPTQQEPVSTDSEIVSNTDPQLPKKILTEPNPITIKEVTAEDAPANGLIESGAFTPLVVNEDIKPIEAPQPKTEEHETNADIVKDNNQSQPVVSSDLSSDAMIAKNDVEMVTVTSIKAKKASALRKETASVSEKKATTLAAQPIQDNAAFDSYLKTQNDRSCVGTNGQPQHGEVFLTFDINRKGRPINIEIDSKLSQDCIDKSKEILKNGPNWDNQKKGKRKATIIW